MEKKEAMDKKCGGDTKGWIYGELRMLVRQPCK
jgi:hypothetical protein